MSSDVSALNVRYVTENQVAKMVVDIPDKLMNELPGTNNNEITTKKCLIKF